MADFNLHFVCTLAEARQLIKTQEKFYVSNCGCRESKGGCSRSRMDVCLHFNSDFSGTGSGRRSITMAEAETILAEAKEQHLVPRPFRNENDRSSIDGICFCCDDCCYYFTADEEECDKGAYIEDTAMDQCLHCGRCVEVCYFKARTMDAAGLIVAKDQCYGCGLCVDVCPTHCIKMVGGRFSSDGGRCDTRWD